MFPAAAALADPRRYSCDVGPPDTAAHKRRLCFCHARAPTAAN